MRADVHPEISIVVPVVERAGDLAELHRELTEVIRRTGKHAEVVYVVDRRLEHVLPVLRALPTDGPEVVLLVLGGSFGESAALTIGLEQSRGEVIATVPAYFQVDPAVLLPALAMLDDGADVVATCRSPRLDSWFNRLQSWVFHGLLRLLTGYRFRDTSCGLRVMRRAVARELQLYGGLHRFVPVLAAQRGFVVRELSAPQRREDIGLRWYGVPLYLKRLLDLATVSFLLSFARRPLRFFGLLGFALSGLGGAICLYLAGYRLLGVGGLADRPLLLLGVLLIVLGIQSVSLGLLGEVIIFTHARRLRDYRIADILRQPESGATTATPHPLRQLPHRAS